MEPESVVPLPLPLHESSTSRRSVLGLSLVIGLLIATTAVACLAVATLLYLRSTNPEGQIVLSREQLRSGQVVELSPASARLTVPQGWSGSSIRLVLLPKWLGFSRKSESTRVTFASPTGSGEGPGAVWVYHGFNSPDWSDLAPPQVTTRNVALDQNLSRLGVRTAIVRDSAEATGAVDVWLFVNAKPRRLLVQLTMPSPSGRLPNAQEVARALRDSGLVLQEP